MLLGMLVTTCRRQLPNGTEVHECTGVLICVERGSICSRFRACSKQGPARKAPNRTGEATGSSEGSGVPLSEC